MRTLARIAIATGVVLGFIAILLSTPPETIFQIAERRVARVQRHAFAWHPSMTENKAAKHGATQAERLSNLITHFYSDGSQYSIPKIYQGPKLYKLDDGSPIPEMARVTCKLLFLAGYAANQDSGVAVEFGSWVGQSSSCIAAGLRTAGLKRRLHCYDKYTYTGGNALQGTKWKSWPQESSILPIFKEIVHRVDPTVVAHRGDMSEKEVSNASTWGGGPVGLFAIDSAKSFQEVIDQTAHGIWEHIQVGGVVVMMDFAKHANQVLSFYAIFVESGAMKNEYVAFTASPWAFSVQRNISAADLKTWPDVLKTREAPYILERARRQIIKDIKAAGIKQWAREDQIQATMDLVLGETKPVTKCIAAYPPSSSSSAAHSAEGKGEGHPTKTTRKGDRGACFS